MKAKETTIYKCDFCDKWYQRKHNCEKHEERCSRNPANRRDCLQGCAHLTKRDTTIFHDTYNGETEEVLPLLYCKVKKCHVYPPITEHKGNAIELGDIDNIPMPKKCNQFELD